MQMKSTLSSITWGFGLVLPLLLLVLGVISILTSESIVPMSQGMGRFSLGGTPASGSRAVLMGIVFISLATFLFGSCFTPVRLRWMRFALGCQIVGFTVFFFLFWHVLIFSR